MASRGRRSLPSRLIPDSRPPLRPRPKPPDLNFHRHNVHTLLLLHSPLVLTTIPLPINAIPCDSSTDQKNKHFSTDQEDEVTPAFTVFRHPQNEQNQSYLLFPTLPVRLSRNPGVRSFRMDDTGKVHVSGYIEPNVLLKCLRKNGKEAHLVHWQYGECSTNLYQNNSYQNSGFQRGGYQNSGYHQGGYGGYDNNNGNGNYSYNHQPLVTYVPSYPPRGDPYASDEESSSWSIM
ncbi:hypothetical protein Tco_0064482 [Tanacetum coccineum]